MSKLELGSINNRTTASQTDNYVGTIADTDSGYLIPKLIQSTQLLESIYGKFDYIDQYKRFINQNIPVCILPIITRESNYNRTSIRFSHGLVQVCHPKYEKTYDSVLLGSIISKDFSEADLIDGVLIINHSLDFYPRCVVAVNDLESQGSREIKTTLRYSEHQIAITFNDQLQNPINDKISGRVTIESFPQLESDPEYLFINHFLVPEQPIFNFYVDNHVIPEIVVTVNSSDPSIVGLKCETSVWIDDEPVSDESSAFYGKYGVHVQPILTNEVRFRIDVRVIPNNLLISQSGLNTNSIFHDSNHNPLFKIEKSGHEAWGSVEFRTDNFAVVTLNDSYNTRIHYNIITTENDFDFNLLNTGQLVMNLILDFTDVKYYDLIKEGSYLDSANYIIIRNATDDVLIRTGLYCNVSTTYYNTEAVYTITGPDGTDLGEGSTEEEKKYDLIDKLHNWYRQEYQNTCYDLNDLLNEFISKYLKENGLPEVDQYGDQVFIDEWKDKLLEQVFIEDFWLAYNQEVYDILKQILDKYDGYNTKITYDISATGDSRKEFDNLRYEVENLKLSNNKLLFEYTVPVSDLNFYKMTGLKTDNSFNLTQDKLCEFSENEKIVEFYSKIKGSTGKQIKISISKTNFYEGIYDLIITNGVMYESWTVRLYDVDNCPLDTIYLSELGKYSELVEAKIYNCWLNNKLIDFIDFNLYDTTSDYTIDQLDNMMRDTSELILPVGDFYLDRVTDELITYDDRLNSIKIYKESDWYPDLFLVDKLPDKPTYVKEILSLVNWNSNKDESIFSQALIKLNGYHLCANQTLYDESNRLMYFYEDLLIDDVSYSSFFNYVINIINQDWLDIPTERLIYDNFNFKVGNYIILTNKLHSEIISCKIVRLVDDYIELLHKVVGETKVTENLLMARFDSENQLIKLISNPNELVDNIKLNYDYTYTSVIDTLVDNKINFLFYNNLGYYYETLVEPLNQPTVFIIQYITSKITREVYKKAHNMVGLYSSSVNSILNQICNKVRRLIPLISSLTYESTFTSNTANVTITCEISSITNRKFNMNYLLNV